MAMAVNVILFQAGWFACVLGAAYGAPWVGALAALALVAWHLGHATLPGREAVLVLVAIALGFAVETALVRSGWVRFDTGVIVAGTAPYWMVALWAIFATTLNVSMRPLRSRPVLAALLGAVGGPLAYYGGARLGALELVATGAALAAIGIAWALVTPLLLAMARRLDGFAAP
jgi:hypothetical protein